MRKADPALQERRREQIAAAAERCFSERGFHQTSMQEVATAAGVSLGLLYRYYANKEALALASAARERAAAVAVLEQLSADPHAVDTLVRLIEEEVRQGLEPARARLTAEILAEAARNPVFAEQLIKEDGAVRSALVRLLDTLKESGRIAPQLSTTACADLVLALLDGLPMRSQLHPDSSAEASAALLGRMLRAVLAVGPPLPA